MAMTEIERLPIWVRYTKKATDRKREQIERALQNAGARFAVHIGQLGSGSDAAPLIYSDTGHQPAAANVSVGFHFGLS